VKKYFEKIVDSGSRFTYFLTRLANGRSDRSQGLLKNSFRIKLTETAAYETLVFRSLKKEYAQS